MEALSQHASRAVSGMSDRLLSQRCGGCLRPGDGAEVERSQYHSNLLILCIFENPSLLPIQAADGCRVPENLVFTPPSIEENKSSVERD